MFVDLFQFSVEKSCHVLLNLLPRSCPFAIELIKWELWKSRIARIIKENRDRLASWYLVILVTRECCNDSVTLHWCKRCRRMQAVLTVLAWKKKYSYIIHVPKLLAGALPNAVPFNRKRSHHRLLSNQWISTILHWITTSNAGYDRQCASVLCQ